MIVIVEAHYDMQCGDCEDAVNEALTKIWHPIYGVIYDEEERLKAGYYEPVERGRDPDVGDTGHPLLQLSLPGLWA